MSRLSCSDSVMAECLRVRASQPDALLTPDERNHWNRCAPCRTAFRRAQRLSSTWRQLEPTSEELAAACARFEVRWKARARGRWVLPGTIAFAVVLVAAAASAAVRILSSRLRARVVVPAGISAPGPGNRQEPPAPHVIATSALTPGLLGSAPIENIPARAAVPTTAGRASNVMAPAPFEGAAGPPPQVAPKRGIRRASSQHAVASSRVEGSPSATVAPSDIPARRADPPPDLGPRETSQRLQNATAAVQPASAVRGETNPPDRADDRAPGAESLLAASLGDSPPTSTDARATPAPSWAAAAAALRDGDRPRAELALGKLVAQGDPRTRDAARLARAQVWWSEGRRAEARAEFASLASGGATPFIRERARSELDVSR